MIDSIIPIILIFLYITFMVLLNCYKSMNIKKKDINKELLKDNPIYLLYVLMILRIVISASGICNFLWTCW